MLVCLSAKLKIRFCFSFVRLVAAQQIGRIVMARVLRGGSGVCVCVRGGGVGGGVNRSIAIPVGCCFGLIVHVSC